MNTKSLQKQDDLEGAFEFFTAEVRKKAGQVELKTPASKVESLQMSKAIWDRM